MARPPSNIIATWCVELVTPNAERLDDLCFRVLRSKGIQLSQDELMEVAEEESRRFLPTILRNIVADERADGVVGSFEIDDELIPYLRKLNSPLPEILSQLKRLTPKAFEEMCAKILESLGGNSTSSGKPNDGGVDFTSFNMAGHASGLPVPASAKIAVIGQAKRYTNSRIGETALREFVGGALRRQKELEKNGAIGGLSPVIFAFWTTSDLDNSAKAYSRDMGVWFMGGLTLASYVEQLHLGNYLTTLPIEI